MNSDEFILKNWTDVYEDKLSEDDFKEFIKHDLHLAYKDISKILHRALENIIKDEAIDRMCDDVEDALSVFVYDMLSEEDFIRN